MSRTKAPAELGRSWLVQRLRKPQPAHPIWGEDNPFAFGGGLVNGGLSKDAMGLLRPIFSFDYMGSAEFEFGAVPEALNKLARTKLAAFTVDVDLSTVPAGWRHGKDVSPLTGTRSLFAFGPDGQQEAITSRVREWARGEERLKERTQLTDVLWPAQEWHSDTIGWLELDNGFFVFADEAAWSTTCDLFGVTR